MSLWEIGWGCFLVGLPFAHFFLYPDQLNMWQAQTFWAQGWLAVLFGLSIGQPQPRSLSNRPLGCWLAWIMLSVVGIWIDYVRRSQQHPIGLLAPLMHCLCFMAFYVAATRQWTGAFLTRLLTWLAYAGLIIVAYGLLQVLSLDQFYRSIDGYNQPSTLMGTIGNPTHFGTYLALLLPIFLWQPQWWWKVVAFITLMLIGLTLSTSALICGLAILIWFVAQEVVRGAWIGVALFLGLALLAFLRWHPTWLDSSGRITTWHFLWQHYFVGNGKQQILGAGLGRIMEDSLRNLPGWPALWRHAHNEWFQVMIEEGVIGFGLVCWMLGHAIVTWRKLTRTPTVKTLGGIGLAFLLSSQLNFPAHLWLLASLGLVAYCGVYVLAAEESP